MDKKEFDKYKNELLNYCNEIMSSRSKHYATEDKLHNFRQITSLMDWDEAEVVFAYQAKHIASVAKIVKECSAKKYPTKELALEKCTDMINYTVLLYAAIMEKIDEKE